MGKSNYENMPQAGTGIPFLDRHSPLIWLLCCCQHECWFYSYIRV